MLLNNNARIQTEFINEKNNLGGVAIVYGSTDASTKRMEEVIEYFPEIVLTKMLNKLVLIDEPINAETAKLLVEGGAKPFEAMQILKSTNASRDTTWSWAGKDKLRGYLIMYIRYHLSGTKNSSIEGSKLVGEINYDYCWDKGATAIEPGTCSARQSYIFMYKTEYGQVSYLSCKQGTQCDSFSRLVSAKKDALDESRSDGTSIKNYSVNRY